MYTPTILTNKVCQFLQQRPRYPIILVQGPPRSGKTTLLKEAASLRPDAHYIDYLKDVMCGNDAPLLGAFAFHEFLDWVISQARVAPVFIDEADALFSTWRPASRETYWQRLLKLECEHPVVLATRFIEVAAPEQGHGVGLVWRL